MSIAPLEQFDNPMIFTPTPLLQLGTTKVCFYAIIIAICLVGFFTLPFLSTRKVLLVGTRWTVTVEALFTTLSSIVKEQLGEGFAQYLPALITLFTTILMANLISNIPYSFGFTTSIIVCLGLSVLIFIGVTILGIYTHRITWFSFFVPANTPLALVPLLVIIESISYIARAFSLGIRLFSNICAGHILLSVLSTMIWTIMNSSIFYAVLGVIPFTIFTALGVLELAVSLIQSFVFTLLTASYLNDSIRLH